MGKTVFLIAGAILLLGAGVIHAGERGTVPKLLPGPSFCLKEESSVLVARHAEPLSFADWNFRTPSLPEPPAETRPQRGLRIDDLGDIAALSFVNEGAVIPYIGAGIGPSLQANHDPARAPILAYRLGLGFGCDLGATTRLNFGYLFRFAPELEMLGELWSAENEIHNISLGIQKRF